jgi:hypothetical protein
MRLVFDEIKQETEAGWLLRFDNKHVWIPFNRFNKIDKEEKIIDIPEWFAIQKGIENFEVEQ